MATQASLYDQMGEMKAAFFSIALLVSAWVGCFQVAELVVVNDMYLAFPGQESIVTAIVSWPMLFVAVSSLLAGFALEKITTKTLVVISAVLLLFGIPIYWLSDNVIAIFVCNTLQAIGAGACQTGGLAIINEVFLDEKRRSRYVGFYNAAMTALGAACAFAGGYLALNGWADVFITNWIGAAILVLTLLFFPSIKPEDRPALEDVITEDSAETSDAAENPSTAKAVNVTDTLGDVKASNGLGSQFWVFFILMFIYFMTIVPLYSLTSILVEESQLGSSVLTGIVTGVMTVCVLPAGLIYGVLYMKFRRKLTIISITLAILGYLWLYLAPSIPSMMTFAVVQGFTYGIVFSTVFSYTTDIVSPQKNGLAMGLMVFCYNLGVFAGVYLFTFGAEIMGSLTQALLIAIVLEAIVVVCEAIIQKAIKTSS